ncbi:polysaccharide deacetylase family protein [Apilactobacillus xinyiensis]|uniref:Polysaccharide deacetylase family protein n=1 Tax=Apilactobacillus xinyiensis TaxID=2841032 RepID=A0ABT0I2X1_9LACO|nr:polysaccharide deacetylase family protein [Apilactobacillus xinyiensis]MCK8625077.1 polysaccharide deacetylase family protein [Apilactobacillus xinyiensis]MCL0318889.1 polysaccharide deacetylase family protein [Apilactobacillus xinyiensis]
MSRTTRKIIITIIGIVIVIALAFTLKKNVQYDRGASENYSLDKQSEKVNNGIMVFCYHRVLKNSLGVNIAKTLSTNSQLHDFEVPINQFEYQMKFLHDHHIKVISGDQMVKMTNSKKPIKGKYAVLTFDDIDRSTIDNAIPVMKKYKFPFTTFIITGNTGEYREGTKLATWNQIHYAKKMAGDLMTVGLHTNNMHYLTKSLVPIFDLKQNYHKFTKDFAVSRKVMRKEMNYYANSFAYPYGGGTTQTNDFLHTQHLDWIATLDSGIVQNNGHKHSNLQYTPRMIINNNSWPSIAEWFSKK